MTDATISATEGIRLGYDGGVWTAVIDDRRERLESRPSFMFVLPILEQSPLEWLQRFHDEAASIGVSDPFPIEELVLHALEHSSGYWKALALGWVEDLDLRMPDLQAQLASLAEPGSTWPSEVVKRARQILRARQLTT